MSNTVPMPQAGYFQGVASNPAAKMSTPGRTDWCNVPTAHPDDTEYACLVRYAPKEVSALFDTVSAALNDNMWELLDLDAAHTSVNETFKYLKILKRFRALSEKCESPLSFSKEGFHFHEHKFNSLDEVEKALNNKAFL